jgi:hypothetical protein
VGSYLLLHSPYTGLIKFDDLRPLSNEKNDSKLYNSIYHAISGMKPGERPVLSSIHRRQG